MALGKVGLTESLNMTEANPMSFLRTVSEPKCCFRVVHEFAPFTDLLPFAMRLLASPASSSRMGFRGRAKKTRGYKMQTVITGLRCRLTTPCHSSAVFCPTT